MNGLVSSIASVALPGARRRTVSGRSGGADALVDAITANGEAIGKHSVAHRVPDSTLQSGLLQQALHRGREHPKRTLCAVQMFS